MKVFFCLVSLMFTLPATAQTGWTTGQIENDEGVYAAVFNDSGVLFGQYCYYTDNACYWMLANRLNCDPADSYPALATSKSVSAHVTLVCAGKGKTSGLNRYFLRPYDTVEGLVNAGGILGVAAVAEGGEFQVHRFDLRGAQKALQEAARLFSNGSRRKDQRL